MKVVDGLINAKKPRPPNPKPSPKDFVWPKQGEADDKTAEKLAATLQELLPAKGWKHVDLARVLWGTMGEAEQPRNTQAVRRWVVAEHPIPNEETAGYVAETLGVSLARLLEPEGKFDPHPPMIRPRSPNGVHAVKTKNGVKKVKVKGAKPAKPAKVAKAAKTDMRGKWKRPKKVEVVEKRKYVKRALPPMPAEGHDPNAWVLAPDVPVPDYEFSSSEEHPGHLKIVVNAIVPHHRAMAILHMLEHTVPVEVDDDED